jgi:hypothetical protein
MNILIGLLLGVGVDGVTANQFLEIAVQAEAQANTVMQKQNAHTELLNCYIKTRGQKPCEKPL